MSATSSPRAPRRVAPEVRPTTGGVGARGSRVGSLRTRPRSKSLIVLAALLVVGCGLAVATLVTNAGQQQSVLAVGAAVTKGHVLERADLTSQSVAGLPDAILVEDVDDVVGKSATVDLVPGQVLTEAMVSSAMTPGEGQAVVGLALDPTRAPSAGLDAGDVVDVIAIPDTQGGAKADQAGLDVPTVLASRATVFEVEGSTLDGGQLLVTLVVEDADAAKVAAYSTTGRVAIVEIPAGSR